MYVSEKHITVGRRKRGKRKTKHAKHKHRHTDTHTHTHNNAITFSSQQSFMKTAHWFTSKNGAMLKGAKPGWRAWGEGAAVPAT